MIACVLASPYSSRILSLTKTQFTMSKDDFILLLATGVVTFFKSVSDVRYYSDKSIPKSERLSRLKVSFLTYLVAAVVLTFIVLSSTSCAVEVQYSHMKTSTDSIHGSSVVRRLPDP